MTWAFPPARRTSSYGRACFPLFTNPRPRPTTLTFAALDASPALGVRAATVAKLSLVEGGFVIAQPQGLTDVRHRFGIFRSTREPDLDKSPEPLQNVLPACLAQTLASLGRPVVTGTHSHESQRLQQHVPRYAEDESEYTVVLERYNTILDELFAGADVYVITPHRTSEAEVP
ncbi:hypothetical protein [Streptomyces sp. NPDC014006]|uniref:DUF3885 domain-containing protein n=1 Tax=Streptomyces sp. NPDC014006 TaxID=3364870 RepID=UPI0036F5D9DF